MKKKNELSFFFLYENNALYHVMNEIDIIIDQVKKVVTFLQYIDSLQVI